MSNDASVAPEPEGADDQVQESSCPKNLNFQFFGYEEEAAKQLAQDPAGVLQEIGRPST